VHFLPLLLVLLVPATALGGGRVKDEVRVFSDGSPEEVWTYFDSIAEPNLREKAFFWPNGAKRRVEMWDGPAQSGPITGWHDNGSLESVGVWEDGVKHGVFKTYESVSKGEKPVVDSEEPWVRGQLHGTVKYHDGYSSNRYVHFEREYKDGQLHGAAIVRRDGDSMERKYSFQMGKLHGRQYAWHHDKRMRFQYEFKDGLPHGTQRRFERGDEPIEELNFVDGKLHGTQLWEWWQGSDQNVTQEWSSGLLTQVSNSEGDWTRSRLELVTPLREDGGYGHPLEQDIRLQGELVQVDRYNYEDGVLEDITVFEPALFTQRFHPNGRISELGAGRVGHRTGPWFTFYDDGALHTQEHHASKKVGTWNVYDRSGQLREVQEWDHYRNSWMVTFYSVDGTVVAEGNVVPASGVKPAKTGTWKYWRDDGTPLREETYGPGPYSGNRPHIKQMIQWFPDGRPEFEGSEKELLVYDYSDDDPDVRTRTRTVKLLDRSRFAHEIYDPETMTIVTVEPKELAVVAQELVLSIGRAVVLADQRHRADGSPKRKDVFNKAGQRHGAFEGWYRDGTRAYAFNYSRGKLRSVEEWWKDSSPRAVLEFRTGRGADDGEAPFVLTAGIWTTEDGNRTVYDRGDSDRRFKDREGALAACKVWKFEPRAQRPE
jgi:antitoxin component YwqK of YwqJK toxin-antitoxin module